MKIRTAFFVGCLAFTSAGLAGPNDPNVESANAPDTKAEKQAAEADKPAVEAKDKAASEKKPRNTVRIPPLKATKTM